MESESLNTEGLTQVGEFDTRVLRTASVDEDYHNAMVAGAVWAFNLMAQFCKAQLEISGPYDDTRPIEIMISWTADKIREVQFPATEEPNA
jgi:hypothetical protein